MPSRESKGILPIVAAPKRALFKAAEVCEVVQVQPYVLRSWEAEFPQIGQAPAGDPPPQRALADPDPGRRVADVLRAQLTSLAASNEVGHESAQRFLAQRVAAPLIVVWPAASPHGFARPVADATCAPAASPALRTADLG